MKEFSLRSEGTSVSSLVEALSGISDESRTSASAALAKNLRKQVQVIIVEPES